MCPQVSPAPVKLSRLWDGGAPGDHIGSGKDETGPWGRQGRGSTRGLGLVSGVGGAHKNPIPRYDMRYSVSRSWCPLLLPKLFPHSL